MALSGAGGSVADWLDGLSDEWIVGTVPQARERLAAYAAAGLDRIMLQHQLHDDLGMVALMGALA
jgi:alkanesulfonate monooxygenase SsuD/methylene tetrahydromethanopterin reductase-like flavin-dependent oxidoreductase (luciferase family)